MFVEISIDDEYGKADDEPFANCHHRPRNSIIPPHPVTSKNIAKTLFQENNLKNKIARAASMQIASKTRSTQT
jgi:hypothetical protein